MQGGTQSQALGRSRGGLTTKVRAPTNAEGLAVALILSPGTARDCTAFDALTAEHEANPKVMLAYRGYDTDEIRGEFRARGAAPEIPTKRNRKLQHTVNRAIYAMRNKIELFFNQLKENRRVANRYDHTAESFLGFVLLATIKLWIRFVHTA